MCGIALIIGKNAKDKSEEMVQMINSISHRGEVTESYIENDLLVYARRLKIVDREIIGGGNYKSKYLKYKNKYLQLKNQNK